MPKAGVSDAVDRDRSNLLIAKHAARTGRVRKTRRQIDQGRRSSAPQQSVGICVALWAVVGGSHLHIAPDTGGLRRE